MFIFSRVYFGIALCLMCRTSTLFAQAPGVLPSDCVKVRYVTGVWADRESTQIAYLVKTPNLSLNRNDYDLYVKSTTDHTRTPGKLLLSGVEVSSLTWFDGDHRIAVLEQNDDRERLVFVDVANGNVIEPFEVPKGLAEYTIDDAGSTVVYSAEDPYAQPVGPSTPGADDLDKGYLIVPSNTSVSGYHTKSLFISHLGDGGKWSTPANLVVDNPFTGRKDSHLEYARHLSLSPDGSRLFFSYLTTGVPSGWMSNPYIKLVATANTSLEMMVIYDLRTSQARLAFNNIICYSQPAWSRDSRSYFIVTHSPVGSRWESDDIRDNQISVKDVNLFQVDADTGSVSEVLRRVPPLFDDEGPLYVGPSGEVITRTGSTSVGRFEKANGQWRLVSTTSLPMKNNDYYLFLAANRNKLFGVHEAITVPENLFSYEEGQPQIQLLTDLNPQVATIKFANVQTIQWRTHEGLSIGGFLFIPPGYDPHKRYPLVIQTKVDAGWFTCDSGANHYPSFAPQPIASAGMFYLIRRVDDTWNYQEDVNKRPVGYPGDINEAVQNMDIWESAIEMLDQKGMIDPEKVGIIGFSRTGFYVEFDLAHSRVKYAAATAADNAQFSYGEYWLFPSMWKEEEAMYGGPPYGASFSNWLKYSVSFNLNQFHTPLLMEEMGYGTPVMSEDLVSTYLATHNEIRIGLERLGKPVEMYYYPNEVHQLDHPKARIASLQRNLDWYRFWLQGYERPNPEDPDQYKRWEHLRALEEAEDKAASHPTAAKPN